MSFRTQPGVANAKEARARVKELYCNRGVDVAEDPKNFDSLLRDRFAGQFRRERGTLVLAAQQGLPARLRRASAAAGPGQLLLAQLAETLRDDAGLDIASARWVAETFAENLRPELLSGPAPRDSAPEMKIAPPAPPAAPEVAPPPWAPAPMSPQKGGPTSKKPVFVLSGILIALAAIVFHFASAPNERRITTQLPAPPSAATQAPVTAPPTASLKSVSPVATGSCNAPNAADDEQMNAAIANFHQAAVRKDWALAAKYENPSTYQGQVGFLDGYAKTAESTPTILKHVGCTVTVALRYRNIDDPQHYCIDQEYAMEYSQRWKIRTAKSVSKRTSC